MQFLMHPASLVQATQPLWAEVMALGTFLGRPNLRGRFRTSLTHGRRYGTNLNFEKAMFFLTFFTPLKINMEPKNEGLEDDYPFQTGDVQVPR